LDAILINHGLCPPRLSRRAFLEILLYGIDPHHPDNRAIFNCTLRYIVHIYCIYCIL
jgi:hypothetical protein